MKSRIKVAWLCPYPLKFLEPELKLRKKKEGHASGWIVNLSKILAIRVNIELHIVTESAVIARSQIIKKNNITFHIIKNNVPFTNRGFPPVLNFLTGAWLSVNKLLKELSIINPHIVHAYGTESIYGIAGVKSGYPCLLSMQGIVSEIIKHDPNLMFHIAKKSEHKIVKQNRYFDCRTEYDKSFVYSLNPKARIFDIPRAITPVYFENEWKVNDSQTILLVGMLRKIKGVSDLLQALALVKKQFPGVSLLLIGNIKSQKYSDLLNEQIRELNIRANVEFLGFKHAGEIARYHLRAQIFVFPSEVDNSPNAVAEAMVSGMPVIATRVGGIPSMIKENINGLLVEPNNPQELASKIIFLLQHPNERKKLGNNARSFAQKYYFPEKVANKVIATYKEILKLEKQIERWIVTQNVLTKVNQ